MGRPELRYEGIKHDIQMLFHDPKAGADALIRRLRAMDRDTLKAIIASRRDVSEEDAEHIVSQMERARDETIAKYERMKEEVQHRIEDAKDRALREAEETRKAARNAAWWTFGSALTSATVPRSSAAFYRRTRRSTVSDGSDRRDVMYRGRRPGSRGEPES